MHAAKAEQLLMRVPDDSKGLRAAKFVGYMLAIHSDVASGLLPYTVPVTVTSVFNDC